MQAIAGCVAKPDLPCAGSAPSWVPATALRLLSDERLAQMAAAGSAAAFGAIFERHHGALHRYCRTIVGNGHDAADVLQSTMLKTLRALPSESREINLRPWLFRIAHNEAISLLRARRGDSGLDAAADVQDDTASAAVEARARLRLLAQDLAELTDQQRETLLMRELVGLDLTEIAGALQISAAAAKQSVYEARCALHAMREGREMACDAIRKTLSDGDRRMLRGKGVRGHLRSCACCRDFQCALEHRPEQLAALFPTLPAAASLAIVHGWLGASGHGGGAGLAATLSGGGTAGSMVLAAKIATIVVVGGAAVGVVATIAPERVAGQAGEPASALVHSRAAAGVHGSAVGPEGSSRPANAGAARVRSGVSGAGGPSAGTTGSTPLGATPAGASPADAAPAGAAPTVATPEGATSDGGAPRSHAPVGTTPAGTTPAGTTPPAATTGTPGGTHGRHDPKPSKDGARRGNGRPATPGAGRGNGPPATPGAGRGNGPPATPGAGRGNGPAASPGSGHGNGPAASPGSGHGNGPAATPGARRASPAPGAGDDAGDTPRSEGAPGPAVAVVAHAGGRDAGSPPGHEPKGPEHPSPASPNAAAGTPSHTPGGPPEKSDMPSPGGSAGAQPGPPGGKPN